MSQNHYRLVLLVSLTVALMGCAQPKSDGDNDMAVADPAMDAAVMQDVRAVPILGKIAGNQLPISMYSLVQLNEQEFNEFDLARDGFRPNFDKHSVILLSLGEQPTGGYAADIEAIQLIEDELYVQAVASAPKSGESVTQQLTYPFSAVIVSKLPEDLTLRSDITSVD